METITETNKSYVGMANCFVCGEVKHLLLDRRLKNSLPQNAVYDKEPCDKCKKIMEQGVLFIGVRNNETDKENPYRTGQIIGLKDKAVKNIIQEPLLSEVLKKRICFVEEDVLKRIGLINETGNLKHKKEFKE
jgi:hypothetical protein